MYALALRSIAIEFAYDPLAQSTLPMGVMTFFTGSNE